MSNEKNIGKEPSGIEVILRDGQSLYIRPIRSDDKKRMKDLFYRLSPQTRYFRFHYPKEHISDKELSYFTEVQPPERCAYVATIGEGEQEQIIAVGRWDVLSDKESAEVAFVVDDNIQFRGIGTSLLEQLAIASQNYRMKQFVAWVLPENTKMIEVFDESGFKTTKQLKEGLYYITLDLQDQEEFMKRQAFREHIARSAGVRRLLYPRSVAVIGASRNPEKVGGAVFRNLLYGGFNGTIFPVNPSAPSVYGVLAYPSVLDVPGDIDIAVIVVPAERVLDVVDECGKKGIWGLVIISAGFGESGAKGKDREQMLRKKVIAYGMRIIGPNCLGLLNADTNVKLNATFSPFTPPPGNVSIGSQSGALGLAILDYAKSINLGIAHFVSIGNRIDISSNDLMEFWEEDEGTDVILLYLESFGNPRKFSRIARRVSRKKPIIAVKSGRSEAGARAALSHTGALAAADITVDAMFRQAGVIRVNSMEEMFNVAETLANQPAPSGPKVGILTNAGGPGVMAADACADWGLKVPTLSQDTQNILREFLPEEAALTNPVDMIASAPKDAYKKALSVLLECPDMDSIIVIYIPTLITRQEDVAYAIREIISQHEGDKPVIACFIMSNREALDLRIDSKYHIPSFTFPGDAVQALAYTYQYSQYRNLEEGRLRRFSDIDTDRVRKFFLSSVTIDKESTWMLPEVAVNLLKEYGIPVAETRIAGSAKDAAKQASEIGFPVVMKVHSATIVHKTDVGGIAIGLRTENEVKDAFHAMKARIDKAGLSNEMQGVILQSMMQDAQEVIIGMSHDPLFGPLVMVGIGGIQVELIKDVAFALHPLSDVEPERMLKELKGLPLLQGWRGSPPRDIHALEDLILRFSSLIEDFPEIDQIEINPLLVFNEGSGCAAVDARILVKTRGYEC